MIPENDSEKSRDDILTDSVVEPPAESEHDTNAEADKSATEVAAMKEEMTTADDGEAVDADTAQPVADQVLSDDPNTTQALQYRWEYAEQCVSDQAEAKRERHRGIRNYAIVMTVCFAVSIVILVISLISGWGNMSWIASGDSGNSSGGYREIYIRDGVDDTTLTMQEISAAGNSVVVAIAIETNYGSGTGSGIVMTSDGYIATNSHVVNGANKITVRMYDGTSYNATLIGESEADDLAVIKINAKGLTAATIGSSSEALVGDSVVVIGHPAGLEFGWTSTYGRLSAIGRDVKIREDDGTLIKKMTLLQTDATVNKGNSGGPMFNAKGEVIGIITLKLAGDYEGLGFAIPIDTAMPLLTALKETGTVDGVQSGVSSARPQLGVTCLNTPLQEGNYYHIGEEYVRVLTEEEAAEIEGSFQAAATGLLVMDVMETYDAYGQLLPGDIITAFNGTSVTSFAQLRDLLYDCNVGDTVTIDYMRDGVSGRVSVQIGAAE